MSNYIPLFCEDAITYPNLDAGLANLSLVKEATGNT